MRPPFAGQRAPEQPAADPEEVAPTTLDGLFSPFGHAYPELPSVPAAPDPEPMAEPAPAEPLATVESELPFFPLGADEFDPAIIGEVDAAFDAPLPVAEVGAESLVAAATLESLAERLRAGGLHIPQAMRESMRDEVATVEAVLAVLRSAR